MELSRRDFLKASGVGLGGVLALGAFDHKTALAKPFNPLPLKKKVGEKTTICPFDGSGCGFLVAVKWQGAKY
jgi:anaerobic selenocysteine-containing dehydrogenase